MELSGRVAVITGAGSGIGRAMARAFAARGAAGVVVADLNGAAGAETASMITAAGGAALNVPTDVSNEAQVVALVSAAEEAYGPIDLFCSNAGILTLGGVNVPDADWERTWSINVMAHVYAARAVLPGMVARGEGYLVHTASAAGLLAQPGAAPYSVTKHAVVALAEWLSITYGDKGIRVSCLCPQAVRTNLAGPGVIGGEPGRHAAAAGAASRDGVLEPEDVADVVVAAIEAEQFLILPHPEVAAYEQRRAEDRDRWLRGMRRMQAALDV
jgi:NAD(P)-dependent dehydrogenase (short-subunit alcohol dehydrogenase family)